MCFHVNITTTANDGKGAHLSVYLYLMKGPHDDHLTWPLRRGFHITVLNQIRDHEHHSVIVYYDDKASDEAAGRVMQDDRAKTSIGCIYFISVEDLHKTTPTCQYLKDDCLFFQITEFRI